MDAALAALGGRVPRLLGPARGLRVGTPTRRPCRPTAAQPGKVTPAESAAEFLASSEVAEVEPPDAGRPHARAGDARRHARREALAARRSRTSSRATRTPTASTSGWRCSRSASPYDDPIVLPFGEGAEHRPPPLRRRARDPLRLRPRLLRHDRELEDARALMFVRDSDELLRRDLPEMAPLRPRRGGAARVLLPALRAPARGRGGRARATRWSTSSCRTSRASTAAGSGASCPLTVLRARRDEVDPVDPRAVVA